MRRTSGVFESIFGAPPKKIDFLGSVVQGKTRDIHSVSLKSRLYKPLPAQRASDATGKGHRLRGTVTPYTGAQPGTVGINSYQEDRNMNTKNTKRVVKPAENRSRRAQLRAQMRRVRRTAGEFRRKNNERAMKAAARAERKRHAKPSLLMA